MKHLGIRFEAAWQRRYDEDRPWYGWHLDTMIHQAGYLLGWE